MFDEEVELAQEGDHKENGAHGCHGNQVACHQHPLKWRLHLTVLACNLSIDVSTDVSTDESMTVFVVDVIYGEQTLQAFLN